jgi:P-type conjugative transfer protein TrbJ
MAMKKQWMACVLIVGLLVMPFTAKAIVPVFDEAAFTQMLVEAVWWLEDLFYQAEQVANQVTQIEQGIIMLENWALSLKHLDFSVIPIVGGLMTDFLRVFDAAQNAFFNAALVKEKFEELYSPFHTELLPSEAYFTKAFDWNTAVREAHWVAMQQQAQLPRSLDVSLASMLDALRASEAAEGHLQAQQAGNQLLGTQIAQQNETNALLGTLAHAQSTKDMMEASIRDQAMMRLEGVMEGWTEWTKEEGLRELPRSFR